MKIVNRGFIFVKPRQAFWDWANQFDQEIQFSEEDDCEGSIYLIEDDFIESEPILKQKFKSIFKTEIAAVSDIDNFTEKIDFDLFNQWFYVEFGTSVFDSEKSSIQVEKTN